MQCLLTLPLDQAPAGRAAPRPLAAFLGTSPASSARAHLETDGDAANAPHAELAGKLRHLQLLWPYLRGEDRPLASA